MKQQVIELSLLQDERGLLEEVINKAQEEFAKTHARALERIKELKADEAVLREEIRELALTEYVASGSKKLFGGIGIREGKSSTVHEYDEAVALEFAKSKDMFITLDRAAFELAIPGLNVDFVETREQPGKISVTFPKTFDIPEEEGSNG